MVENRGCLVSLGMRGAGQRSGITRGHAQGCDLHPVLPVFTRNKSRVEKPESHLEQGTQTPSPGQALGHSTAGKQPKELPFKGVETAQKGHFGCSQIGFEQKSSC